MGINISQTIKMQQNAGFFLLKLEQRNTADLRSQMRHGPMAVYMVKQRSIGQLRKRSKLTNGKEMTAIGLVL